MLSSLDQRGFTLVELLDVGLTLLALLLGLGVPAMGTYLQNSKLASAAASYYSGLQMARTEAIRRNVRTEFVLTDTPISTANLANVAGADVSGRNWLVRAASGAEFAVVEAEVGRRRRRQLRGCGDPGHRRGLRSRGLRRPDRVQRIRRHRRRSALLDRHLEPGRGHVCPERRQGSLPAHHVSPGGQIAACDPAAAASAGDSRAC